MPHKEESLSLNWLGHMIREGIESWQLRQLCQLRRRKQIESLATDFYHLPMASLAAHPRGGIFVRAVLWLPWHPSEWIGICWRSAVLTPLSLPCQVLQPNSCQPALLQFLFGCTARLCFHFGFGSSCDAGRLVHIICICFTYMHICVPFAFIAS